MWLAEEMKIVPLGDGKNGGGYVTKDVKDGSYIVGVRYTKNEITERITRIDFLLGCSPSNVFDDLYYLHHDLCVDSKNLQETRKKIDT